MIEFILIACASVFGFILLGIVLCAIFVLVGVAWDTLTGTNSRPPVTGPAQRKISSAPVQLPDQLNITAHASLGAWREAKLTEKVLGTDLRTRARELRVLVDTAMARPGSVWLRVTRPDYIPEPGSDEPLDLQGFLSGQESTEGTIYLVLRAASNVTHRVALTPRTQVERAWSTGPDGLNLNPDNDLTLAAQAAAEAAALLKSDTSVDAAREAVCQMFRGLVDQPVVIHLSQPETQEVVLPGFFTSVEAWPRGVNLVFNPTSGSPARARRIRLDSPDYIEVYEVSG